MIITVVDELADTLSTSIRAQLDACARQTEQEARQLLAPLPAPLRLTIRVGDKAIPETQYTATPLEPDHVEWIVAPAADMDHISEQAAKSYAANQGIIAVDRR